VRSAALFFRLAGLGDLKLVLQIYHDVGTWLHDAKGIADQWPREMLDWACILARSHGKRLLRLDCMYENPGLRKYHCQAGFLLLGQHPTYSWYALFEKRLTIKE